MFPSTLGILLCENTEKLWSPLELLTALRWPKVDCREEVDCDFMRSSQPLLGMEDFVDIEKMFAADLAMDLDLPLPLPKPLSLGNTENEEKKAVGVTGEEIGAVCVTDIAPNVSKDAWDLLDVIEGDSEFNTHGIVSTNEALSSLKSQENQICYVNPNTVSDNELAFRNCMSDIEKVIKHKEPVMETPVFKTYVVDTKSVKLEDPVMEVPVWTSLPDPVHLFEVAQDCKSVVDVDTPVFLANMELPTDVSTPDVDLSFLTNQTLELLPTPALNEALKSVEYSGLNQVAKKVKDTSDEENVPYVSEPTTPPTVAGILRLNTGNDASFSPGKGAALQLRRKGVKRQLEASKIEVKQENDGLASDNSTTTIIITLTGSSSSPTTTNITCVTKDADKDEVPLKKAKLGEKYIDMRRKNNEASKRSRQTRKEREQEMAKLAENLTKENAELQQKVTALEALRDSVKAELMKVLSGRK